MRMVISPNETILKLAALYPFEMTNDNIRSKLNNMTALEFDHQKIYIYSVFNYVCVGKKCVTIYNSLYSSLAVLDFSEYEAYCNNNCTDKLLCEFVENGLLVREGLNEKKFYLECSSFLDKIYAGSTITLAVTHNCNARCGYCYEKGICLSSMDDEMIEKVIDFLSSLNPPIAINWFGGEPLLNCKAIDSISQCLNEKRIKFLSYLITNGSLITDDIIEKMINCWNVKNVQISIDGQEESYLRIKNYKSTDENIYKKILGNIIKIARKGIFVTIRINISRENLNEIYSLQQELEYIFSRYRNISIYPAFVKGTGESFSESEMIEIVSEMMRRTRNVIKLTTNIKLFSLPRLHSCAVHDKNAFSIDSDGYLYKCENMIGIKNSAVGNISAPDKINNDIVSVIPDKCSDCVFLPKCMGGCKSDRLAGENFCFIEKYIIIGYMNLISNL